MELYIASISDVTLDDIKKISPDRAKKAERLRLYEDKLRCITGGLLIKRFLGEAPISKNKFGKPIAENGVEFNLSHSGDYVILAVSNQPIGCDIEKVKLVSTAKMGRFVFGDKELKLLTSSTDRLTVFFDLWTKKEALLKCIGEGFHRNAKTVDVSQNTFSENNRIFYFKTFHFADYTISLCSSSNQFPTSIQFVNLTDIGN